MRYRFTSLVVPLALLLLPGCKKNDLEPDAGIEEQLDAAPEGAEAGLPGLDRGPGQDGPLGALDGSAPAKDGPKKKIDAPPIPPDFTSPVPALDPAVATTVAAIQFSEGQANLVKPACASAASPDVCAVKELILQARQKGASIIVTPEGACGQIYQEPLPSVGENPGQDTTGKWDNLYVIRTYSYLAKQIGVHLIVNVQTYEGVGAGKKLYNTNIAFGPDGTIVDVHKKFNLYGDENGSITPGSEVSVFDTPLGKTGQLVCADIYGSSTLLGKLSSTLKARVVLISSMWFSVDPIPSYFVAYAKKYGVYAVVSNNTLSPGYSGAIIKPDGILIASVKSQTPSVLVGTIPLP